MIHGTNTGKGMREGREGGILSFIISSLPVALAEVEPRIHFALVCGAKSCPPIKTYSPGVSDHMIIT